MMAVTGQPVAEELTAELGGHGPVRPSWLCPVDGDPWPCEPARRLLAQGETVASLVIRMSLYRPQAIVDTGLSPAEINDRFIGWIG